MLAAIGVVALVAVAVLVFLGSRGSSGGAKSPEDAVRSLASAISAEDPLAAIATMDPDEVKALGTVYSSVEDQARTLGYAPEGAALGGVDLDVTGLTLRTQELDRTVARVTITGGSVGYDVRESELGQQLKRFIDRQRRRDGSTAPASDSGELDATRLLGGDGQLTAIMVVKRHGGWYISPTYTAAEYLAQGSDLPPGRFADVAPTKATAPTPEAAAEALARAVAANDLDAVVSQLSGPELLAVQAYKASLRKLLADHPAFGEGKVATDDVRFTTTPIDADRTQVTIASVTGTARWPDDGDRHVATFTWDGTCLKVREDGDDWKNCLTVDSRRFALTDASVVAVKEGRRWRISPIETALRYITRITPKLDGNLVAALLGAPDLAAPTGVAKVGSTLDAALNDAGFAVYDLPVAADQAFTLHADDLAGGEGVFFALVKPSGAEEHPSDGEVVEADEAGTWKLVVQRDHLAPATARVTIGSVLQRNVTVGKPATGAINQPGQVVRYKVNPVEAKKVTIAFDNANLRWRLLDKNDEQVDAGSDGTYALDPSDTYTVEVSSPGVATGRYRLTLTAAVDFVLGNGTTTTATGTISAATSVLTIDLKVSGGATVLATLSTTVPTMDLTMTVVDPQGRRLPYNVAGPGRPEEARFTPAATTTFTIEITATGGLGDISLAATSE